MPSASPSRVFIARRALAGVALLPAAACVIVQTARPERPPRLGYASAASAGGRAADRSAADSACDDARQQRAWDAARETYCEVRTFAFDLPAGGVTVDAGAEGAVTARGADTARRVTVAAAIRVWAGTTDEARRIAEAVRVAADGGGTVRATGPARRDWQRDGWWSVDYVLTLPARAGLAARSNNGGIRVTGVAGRLRLDTNNGGVTLDAVGGDVVARTNNGGVVATLAGRAWDTAGLPDAGLDLHTNNGGAVVRVPAGYSARLSVGTNNGGLTVDFPVTVQGRLDQRRLDVALGAGGAPVRVFSNNGGARLTRAE